MELQLSSTGASCQRLSLAPASGPSFHPQSAKPLGLGIFSRSKTGRKQIRFPSLAYRPVADGKLLLQDRRVLSSLVRPRSLRIAAIREELGDVVGTSNGAQLDHVVSNDISVDINKDYELESSAADLGAHGTKREKVARWHDFGGPGILLGLGGLVAGLNLEGPGSVVEAVAVLAAIVTVHECGHFLAARWQNIHVTKFSIGFGPILSKFQGEKVEYTLRAIPLGGFVAFPDDDPESQIPPTDPDLLKNRPILDRALVISAGVIANVLFAYSVLFTQVNTVGLLQQTFQEGVAVPDVVAGSAADKAGLVRGDVILGVNGTILPPEQQSVLSLVDEIKANKGQQIALDVLRGTKLLTLEITPDATSDGSGRIGVQLAPNADTARVKASNLGEAVVFAAREFSRLFTTVTDGLQQIFFNFAQTAERVSGPVAIVAVGAEVARSDSAGLFQFAALVNINLAVVNILPLPALDGGYLALLLLEALRGGRKLPTNLEQGIMSSGILFLLGTGVLLMVRDTLTLGGIL